MSFPEFLKHLISFSSLAALFGSTIVIISTFINPEKNTKAKLWFRVLSIAGGVILFTTGSFSDYNMDELLDEIKVKASANSRLAQKNTELNEEIHNYQTGGDSYVYVQFYHSADSHFKLMHKGKYPVYNLTVVVTKFDNPNQIENPAELFKVERNTTYQYPVLTHSVLQEIELPIDNNSTTSYFINYSSNQKQWKQFIFTIKLGDRLEYASMVIRHNHTTGNWEELDLYTSEDCPELLKQRIKNMSNSPIVAIEYFKDPSRPLEFRE